MAQVRPEWRSKCANLNRLVPTGERADTGEESELLLRNGGGDIEDEESFLGQTDIEENKWPVRWDNELKRVVSFAKATLSDAQQNAKQFMPHGSSADVLAEDDGMELKLIPLESNEAEAQVIEAYATCQDLLIFCDHNERSLLALQEPASAMLPALTLRRWVDDVRREFDALRTSIQQTMSALDEAYKQVGGNERDIALAAEPLSKAAFHQGPGDSAALTGHQPFRIEPAWNIWWLLLSLVVLSVLLFVPMMSPDNQHAHRCLAMLACITVMWVTEALPFFVTALCVPILCLLLRVFEGTAEEAAHLVLGKMFNHTSALLLGGFAISSAFSKFGFELLLVAAIQRRLGHRPWLFLLAFMTLAWALSMFISNVAAPVLCSAVILPVLRDLPHNSAYVRAVLIGLALACNIGGMLTPIASPQNVVALGYLSNTMPNRSIAFYEWVAVTIPFCTVLLLLAWAYVVAWIQPNDVQFIPPIAAPKRLFGFTEYFVILTSLATVVLWCTLELTRPVFGDMGIIALFPLVLFLASGVLTKEDFKAFGWDLIVLISGGNVLGAAIQESKLLDMVAEAVVPQLTKLPAMVQVMALGTFVLIVTTFVSHTVGAIILTPMVVSVGKKLGNVEQLVMSTTLMYSAAMAMPMSSFPNINSLMVEDKDGRKYVTALTIVKFGTPFSIIAAILILTLAYGLMLAVF